MCSTQMVRKWLLAGGRKRAQGSWEGGGYGGSLNLRGRVRGLGVSAEIEATGLEEGEPEGVMGNQISEETIGFILGCSSLRSSGNLGVAFWICLGVGDQIAGERQEARMAQPAPSRGPAVKDA